MSKWTVCKIIDTALAREARGKWAVYPPDNYYFGQWESLCETWEEAQQRADTYATKRQWRTVSVTPTFVNGGLARETLYLVAGDRFRQVVPTRDIHMCPICYRTWDDGQVTAVTPSPGGRCPFEDKH